MSRASHQLLTSSAHSPFIKDRSLGAVTVPPGTAAFTLYFFEAGFLRFDGNAGSTILPSEWANQTLGSQSIAAPYEIRLTVLSGSSPSSGDTVGSWLSMVGGAGGARSWGLSRSSLGATIGSWLIEIRSAATGLVLTSATYSANVSVSSP